MSLLARVGLGATLISLLACGSGGGGGGGQPTLSISPQTASAVIGGPAVSFTANLSGSSNPIAWTVNGPGSITPAAGTTTAYTPPPFGGTPTTATVTATASGLNASATIQVGVPASINVSGTVVGSDRAPVVGASVTIGAQSAVTDAAGAFTISGVALPYDLTAVVTVPKKRAVVYQGLTRRDPAVVVIGVTASPYTGTLTGNLSGGNPLGGANEATRVIFASPDAPAYLLNDNNQFVTSNPYTMNAAWVGPTTTTGTVHAIQWQADGGSVPSSFTGYANKSGVSISSGGNATADLAMTAPSVSTIGGTVHLDASLLYFGQSLWITFPNSPAVFMGADSPSGSFSYPFPNVGGATASVIASAINTFSNVSGLQISGITPGTANVVVQLAAPPTPGTPMDHATSVGTSTDFTWTPMPGTISVLGILGNGTSPTYYVLTAGASARIPDLSAQGLGLPPAAPYRWVMNAYGPLTSVDEMAGSASMYLSGSGSYFGGTTAPRDFTTP